MRDEGGRDYEESPGGWHPVCMVATCDRISQRTGKNMGANGIGAANAKEHRTVSRAAAILESAAASPDGVSLTDMTSLLQAPKSSIHGLLRGLVAVGYLIERDHRYVTAPGLPSLLTAAYSPSLEELARPAMTRLRDEFDESVMLGVLASDSIVYVASLESRDLVRYSAPLHQRRLLHPSSMGKLYLADLPADELDIYFREYRFDSKRADVLRQDLAEVRKERVGYNREETFAGVTAVAAGIRDSRGALVACMSIAGPTFRMAGKLDRTAAAVRAEADSVSVDFIQYDSHRGQGPRRPSATGLVREVRPAERE
jgi:DNA-binding IclR family transcriptional regulator